MMMHYTVNFVCNGVSFSKQLFLQHGADRKAMMGHLLHLLLIGAILSVAAALDKDAVWTYAADPTEVSNKKILYSFI